MRSDTKVLESLAFLYLTFGHSTDGNLSGEEMRALADKLRARSPETDLQELGAILKAAVAEYKGTADKLATAKGMVGGLAAGLDAATLRSILDDLEAIATADGEISDGEREFITDTAKTFGLR
ncbi:MAG: TerB family tellurite resistance protein [Nannocystaceae bacterium]